MDCYGDAYFIYDITVTRNSNGHTNSYGVRNQTPTSTRRHCLSSNGSLRTRVHCLNILRHRLNLLVFGFRFFLTHAWNPDNNCAFHLEMKQCNCFLSLLPNLSFSLIVLRFLHQKKTFRRQLDVTIQQSDIRRSKTLLVQAGFRQWLQNLRTKELVQHFLAVDQPA